MAEGRGTAADRLSRLLYLLPAATARAVPLAEAAEHLGVTEDVVAADLAEVIAREFYHPAGGTGDLRVEVEAGAVRVHSSKFHRPVALDGEESLATLIALRRYASGLPRSEQAEADELIDRVAAHVASAAPAIDRNIVVDDVDASGLRALLQNAALERRVCRITYLRPGSSEETRRDLHPYALVYGEGRWNAVGYCGLRKDVRVFRVDRILGIEVKETSFEVPSDFRVEDFVTDGRLFRADQAVEAKVRYTGAAARRLEAGSGVDPAGGRDGGEEGVERLHRVADPDWLVRHVLRHGGDAEVVEPPELRESVRRAAEGLSRIR